MELYLESFGTRLRAKDDLFEITIPDLTGAGNHRVEQIAPHQVRTILFQHHTSISADAILLALKSDTDIILCDHFGHPVGRFISTILHNTVNILKAQVTVSNHAPSALGFARDWLALKAEHQIKLLNQMAAYRNEQAKALCICNAFTIISNRLVLTVLSSTQPMSCGCAISTPTPFNTSTEDGY